MYYKYISDTRYIKHNILIMILNNISLYIEKVKLHPQNASTKFHLQNLRDDCQLNDNQRFFIELQIKK